MKDHTDSLRAAIAALEEYQQERQHMVKLLESLAQVITPNHHRELAQLNWALARLKEPPKLELVA